MIPVLPLFGVVWLHFLGDFVLQTDWMAQNKSKSVWPLTAHVLVYSGVFVVPFGWKYALANGLVHWYVDFVTSRITSQLWARKEVHWFFTVIGLDQAIHLSTLVLTLVLANSGYWGRFL